MKGNTLIETLVYVSLLSILMIGVFSSVYVLIRSEERTRISNENDSLLILKNYHE